MNVNAKHEQAKQFNKNSRAAKVQETMEEWHRLVEDRDAALTQSANWESSFRLLERETEILRKRVEELDNKLGFYMRHSSEMLAHFDSIQSVMELARQKSKEAAYRPTMTAPNKPQMLDRKPPRGHGTVDDGEPVPKFLTDEHLQPNE